MSSSRLNSARFFSSLVAALRVDEEVEANEL
jgi:hypothetical protein